VLSRSDMFAHHHVHRDPLSVRQRMTDVLSSLTAGAFMISCSCSAPKKAAAE